MVTKRSDDVFRSGPVIRLGLVVSAVIALPAVVLGAALHGGAGAFGALLGAAVVVVFFAVSKLAVGQVARRAPHLLLPVALGTYVVKIGLLGVLLTALDGVTAVHLPTMAWTVFAGVFGWLGAELWVASHTRVPFFDPAGFAARQETLGRAAPGTAALGPAAVGQAAVGQAAASGQVAGSAAGADATGSIR